MAEIKYLSLERLGYYDEKIKGYIDAGDAATLAAANKYFEDNASRFDPAGTAQTKMEELANGAVADNTAAIGVLNGEGEGSVKKAVADAKGLIDGEIARVEGKADAAQGAADKAQGEVDALETYVGTFTSDTAKSVVEYIDEKTAGIASDAVVGALAERVTQAEKDIDAIEADYLKGADKEEVVGLIEAEAERAKGIEGGLETRLKAVEDDYLVEADKTELQGKIDEVGGKVTTLIGEDANKSVRAIAGEVIAEALIPEGAAESLDTLEEIAAWIQAHPDDASAMNAAIVALQNQLKGIDAGEGTVKKYVDDAIVALNMGQYALAADLTALAGRMTTAEGKITDLEGKAHVHENADVLNGITAAKVSAWDASEQNAKDHADSLNTAMNARVEALEAIDHTHGNAAVLDGITAEKVAAWDAAEQNAKDYADGKDASIAEAKKAGDDAAAAVKTLEEGQVATNAGNITAIDGRVAALEAVTHTEILESEIDALFA